jgi:hypothetical protein
MKQLIELKCLVTTIIIAVSCSSCHETKQKENEVMDDQSSNKTESADESNIEKRRNISIGTKYIQFLNDYYPNGLGSFGENVEIKRINERTFWITSVYGSGIKQEIYWMLHENCIIPYFEFEYGGMNWESGLNYTFFDINKNKTISGNVHGSDSENQIENLKQKFIN